MLLLKTRRLEGPYLLQFFDRNRKKLGNSTTCSCCMLEKFMQRSTSSELLRKRNKVQDPPDLYCNVDVYRRQTFILESNKTNSSLHLHLGRLDGKEQMQPVEMREPFRSDIDLQFLLTSGRKSSGRTWLSVLRI